MKAVELTLTERKIIMFALEELIKDLSDLMETEEEFMKEPLKIAIEERKQIIEKLKK